MPSAPTDVTGNEIRSLLCLILVVLPFGPLVLESLVNLCKTLPRKYLKGIQFVFLGTAFLSILWCFVLTLDCMMENYKSNGNIIPILLICEIALLVYYLICLFAVEYALDREDKLNGYNIDLNNPYSESSEF